MSSSSDFSGHRRRSSPHRRSSNASSIDKAHLKGEKKTICSTYILIEFVLETTKRLLEQNQSIISTKCRLQFNFISLCLLHHDIQTSSTSLKDFADGYFANIATINTSGMLDEKQIYEHRLRYSQACAKDHLSYVFHNNSRNFYRESRLFRLIGKPLIIDFTQQSAENCLCLDLDIRFSSVDLCECLQGENTNIQQKIINTNQQMVFNRVNSHKKSFSSLFNEFLLVIIICSLE